MQNGPYSISELAGQVNAWCAAHQIEPLHNSVGPQVTVRNIRYYQTLGLVDRPSGPHGKGFGEKHRLQLAAIRLLQSKGLPLERIRELLHDRTEKELEQIEQRGVAELERLPETGSARVAHDWRVVPLGADLLLLTRSRKEISPGQRQRIMEILEMPMQAAPSLLAAEPEEAFRPEID